ncbi:MAG: GAF domain-containing protein [Deltaproteobacteria bacterium]|nr:GAF domain-containing protein [Deltaproteobacteria bacterium]
MSGPGRKRAKLKKAREEVAKRDVRIGEMEQAHVRLQQLYEISKLLTRFQSVEATVPQIVEIVARALPLRSAILILADRAPSVPRMIAWQAKGQGEKTLQSAKTHAQAAYGYLARSHGDLERGDAKALELPRRPATEPNSAKENFIVLPLVVHRGLTFGALQIGGAGAFDELDLIFINAVVNQLAVGLDRDSADRAQRRLEHERKILAEVGSVIGTTLDYRETLTSIAHLLTRDLGDFCVVDIVDEQGEVRRLEVVSADPAKVGIAERLGQFPLDRSRPHLSRQVLQSKKGQLMPDVSRETLRALAQGEEYLRLLEEAGPTSVVGVPLVVHERLLGALIVVSCRPERRYEAADLRLLEEVGRRAALALENSRLYGQVTRAVQERDDVLGIVAHDLRNPLSTILIQASLLRRRGMDPERPTREPAEAIERAATRMNRLIQDLLDVTRMEAGRLSVELARVPAGQVVSESVEAQKPIASSASLELQLEVARELPEILADRDRLLQVFENLIGNAIKFTEARGRIVIGAAPRDGEVLFWVTDTGAGIAAEDLPHLFDRFWQSRKSGRRGAGLGLPIAKGIVEAHGGRIWVESTPGRGSTFFFTIPKAPQAEQHWEPSPPQPHGP